MERTHPKVGDPPPGKAPAPLPEDWSADAVEEAFRLLEGRWKTTIVFHLFDRPTRRFSELERAIPRVTQKMLAQQLRGLERDGVVRRAVFAQVPPRVEYSLTDLGRALRPALDALVRWAVLRRGEAFGEVRGATPAAPGDEGFDANPDGPPR